MYYRYWFEARAPSHSAPIYIHMYFTCHVLISVFSSIFAARLLGVRPAEYTGRNGESTSSGVRPPPTPTPGEPQKTSSDAEGMVRLANNNNNNK